MTEVPWVRCCVCGGVCVLDVCWREMHRADRRSYLCLQIGCVSHGAAGAQPWPAMGWRPLAMAGKSLLAHQPPSYLSRLTQQGKRSPVNYVHTRLRHGIPNLSGWESGSANLWIPSSGRSEIIIQNFRRRYLVVEEQKRRFIPPPGR